MRLVAILPLVVLAACSTSPGALAPAPEPDVRLNLLQGQQVISVGGTVVLR